MYRIALDNDRDIAAELGLLLSCYAIIDLFIPHIFSVISGHSKNSANIFLSRIKGNSQRISLIRELITASTRPQKDHELSLIKQLEEATKIRNQYAHAIYSQVAASPTGWRMSMWLSDGSNRKKEFKDISIQVIRNDGMCVRSALESLFHFGSIEVAYA